MSDTFASTSFKRADGVIIYPKRKKPGPVTLIIPDGAPPPTAERLKFIEKENQRIEKMSEDYAPVKKLKDKKGVKHSVRKALKAEELPPTRETIGTDKEIPAVRIGEAGTDE